jgi:hypothetical protein
MPRKRETKEIAEIDALITCCDGLKLDIEILHGNQSTLLKHSNELADELEKRSDQIAALKAENERLRKDAERLRDELFKANCKLSAKFSNSFEKPYEMPDAAMKDFSTTQKEEECDS